MLQFFQKSKIFSHLILLCKKIILLALDFFCFIYSFFHLVASFVVSFFMLDSFAAFFKIIVPIVKSKLFNLLLTLYYTVVALRWGHKQQEKVLRFFFGNFNLQYFNMNFLNQILACAEKNPGELYSCFIFLFFNAAEFLMVVWHFFLTAAIAARRMKNPCILNCLKKSKRNWKKINERRLQGATLKASLKDNWRNSQQKISKIKIKERKKRAGIALLWIHSF